MVKIRSFEFNLRELATSMTKAILVASKARGRGKNKIPALRKSDIVLQTFQQKHFFSQYDREGNDKEEEINK